MNFFNNPVKGYYGFALDNFKHGKKFYELTDHLGNVLVTVSDKKLGFDNGTDGLYDFYNADLMTVTDFFPGGMLMPGRSYNSGDYRYSFNGQEKTDEISGAGNHTTAMFWEYDPRIISV